MNRQLLLIVFVIFLLLMDIFPYQFFVVLQRQDGCIYLGNFLRVAVAWYVQVVHGQCPEGHIELWTVDKKEQVKSMLVLVIGEHGLREKTENKHF